MKHVYVRNIDPAANDSLAIIARRIAPQQRVLDVGTGSGALGRYLQANACTVDGLTYSREEALQAAPFYQRIETIDLEQTLPSTCFAAQSYDVIVCADILEHVRNAAEVLADLRALLVPGGCVLLSIPNATYMGVLFGLLAGRFVRTREGLLDATHVNFFDRQGLRHLIEQAGFNITAEQDVRKGLIESEFSALDTLALPASIREYVPSLPDAEVYQFVWELAPITIATGGAIVEPPPVLPVIRITPQFAAQIFWDVGDGFDEALSAQAYGEMLEAPQTLRFDLTLSHEPRRFRLDLADRPGILELFAFRLLNECGEEIACWKGDWAPELLLNECEILSGTGVNGGRLVRATGDDPWVVLPAAPAWQRASSAELRITAPQPYKDAAFLWAEHHYSERIAKLEADIAHLREDMHAKALERQSLVVERDTVLHRIAAMEASTSWRLTAGLRWLSNVMRRS